MELPSNEPLIVARWLGTVVDWQQECDFIIPLFPQSCAMRLQQSRSPSVIAAAGTRHAMIGVANKSSDKSETPILPIRFIAQDKV